MTLPVATPIPGTVAPATVIASTTLTPSSSDPTQGNPQISDTPLAQAAVAPVADPVVPAVAPVVPVAADPAIPAVVAPVADPAAVADYELELDDTSPLSQEDLDAIAQEASDNNLNKEQAEALIKTRESFFEKGNNSYKIAQDAKLKASAEALNSHPDFVGDARVESFANINRAVQAFGNDDLVAALNDPYIGNNLALASFLSSIGKAMGADPIEGKGTFTTPASNADSQIVKLQNMYPEHF